MSTKSTKNRPHHMPYGYPRVQFGVTYAKYPVNTTHEVIFDLNVLIALCKGVRSCKFHPISHFVTCNKLSPSSWVCTTSLSSTKILTIIHEALSILHWKLAVQEEERALQKKDTRQPVELPNEKKNET